MFLCLTLIKIYEVFKKISDGSSIQKYLFICFWEIIVIAVFIVISDLVMINYSLS